MKKLGWALSIAGMIFILLSILYPLDMINKNQFLILLFSGAGIMFAGSMIRTLSILRKK
ncbi:hypothetical protein [Peribacillus deserti]|uniref:hypothetical protein n=1 Tax=Peribacillus deserti TaxID=673318 RepID=UPI0015E076EA|nr:hypothetical protein [Peribacillus deserti]